MRSSLSLFWLVAGFALLPLISVVVSLLRHVF
jgi:hypothetical protein